MKISANAIVSNSDMIKNYRACWEKAVTLGKIFILKNNQPEAVLFSISEYEKIAVFIEYMGSLDPEDFDGIIAAIPKEGNRRRYTIDSLKHELIKSDNN